MMDEHAVTELLLACLHQQPTAVVPTRLSGLTPSDWQHLVALATDQRVETTLYHRLKTLGLLGATPPAVTDGLCQTYRRTARYNLWLQHELGRMATALQARHIPLVLLKGLFLATAVYPAAGMRRMIDIDIMVPRTQLQAAKDALLALGYSQLQAGSVATDAALFHHLGRLIIADMSSVEVHWNITLPDQRHSIDPDELWERALPLQIAETSVLALAPEDLLLHLCLHTSYQHQFAFGLRPFCDIAEVINRYGMTLDWAAVIGRAERWGWGRGVYLAGRLAAELVGAAVPPEVLMRLKPVDLDPTLVTMAKGQVLGDATLSRIMTPSFGQLWQPRSLWAKGRLFAKRIGVPRLELAQHYGVPSNSPALYLYYLVRTKDLLVRYGRAAWGYRRNRHVTEFAARQNVLAEWLALE